MPKTVRILTGARCDKCERPVEQNNKRTKSGHADCFPKQPIIRGY